jgi:acetyltransferase
MRQLFPLRSTGRAHPLASAVAVQVHAYLSEAHSVDDFERRLRLPQRYPRDLIGEVRLRDGRAVLVRPVLPRDAALQRAFVRSMSTTTRLFRFHGAVTDLPEPVLRYLTEIDYEGHLALVGEVVDGEDARQVAEARWVRRAGEGDRADFAIAIADDYQHSGLGNAMLDRLQRSALANGVDRLCGHVLRNNRRMLGWLQGRGWTVEDDPSDPEVVCVERGLRPVVEAAQVWREAA